MLVRGLDSRPNFGDGATGNPDSDFQISAMMQLKTLDTKTALASAVAAAQAAGKLMRDNLNAPKRINESSRHDIKLELDVRCQKQIEQTLRKSFTAIPVLGEERSEE